jgi:hypothetical protein
MGRNRTDWTDAGGGRRGEGDFKFEITNLRKAKEASGEEPLPGTLSPAKFHKPSGLNKFSINGQFTGWDGIVKVVTNANWLMVDA